MKIKKMVTDIKIYLYLLGIIAIGWGVASNVAALPDKVEKLESRATKTEDAVESLANEVQEYIAVNKERVIGQEKREDMIFQLIQEIRHERNAH